MIYELKKYTAHEGKYAALTARFMQTTLPVFQRVGIEVAHVWTSPEEPGVFYYVTRFASQEARAAAWAAFMADPEWKEAKARSEADGPLLASQSTTLLQTAQFLPPGAHP